MNVDIKLLCGAAAVAGIASAILYARKRRWAEAGLSAVAGMALAALLAAPTSSSGDAEQVVLDTSAAAGKGPAVMVDDRLASALAQLPAAPPAAAVALRGHGLFEAQWRDLPLRTLAWTPAKAGLLWLEFPRSLPLGRNFTLTVRRDAAQAGWRLQLLAENKQVLAESRADAARDALTVQWRPPMAESMVLQARRLDKEGRSLAQGPVPVRVLDAVPLQVQGRFGAPSFDARALNRLLTDSNAIVDWQTTLGKALTRSEEARVPLTQPNLLLADTA